MVEAFMEEQYALMLTGLPLFQGYTTNGARFVLESGEIKKHEAGEVLCREGDAPTFVLLVLSGKVQVFVERQGRTLGLTEAGPGAILGELGVLCGIARAASLRASEALVVLRGNSRNSRITSRPPFCSFSLSSPFEFVSDFEFPVQPACVLSRN
jgi:Cyclic nucleotide-binding domain